MLFLFFRLLLVSLKIDRQQGTSAGALFFPPPPPLTPLSSPPHRTPPRIAPTTQPAFSPPRRPLTPAFLLIFCCICHCFSPKLYTSASDLFCRFANLRVPFPISLVPFHWLSSIQRPDPPARDQRRSMIFIPDTRASHQYRPPKGSLEQGPVCSASPGRPPWRVRPARAGIDADHVILCLRRFFFLFG